MTPQPPTNDLSVYIIRQDATKIRFIVDARKPFLTSETFDRSDLKLEPKEMAELESGEPRVETVAKVVLQISQWFAREENDTFRLKVREALSYDGPVRFIFRLHEELAQQFRTIPLELCNFEDQPLAFKPNVRSIIHLLPYQPNAPSSIAQAYPFRVLVVRANPRASGGAVPRAAELRQSILQIGTELAPGAVEVDLLSRDEEGAIALPTFENFRQCVLGKKYHVMLFLGHGELRSEGSILKFEQEGGDRAKDVWPFNLRDVLSKNPVPVVLLAGCLTAAVGPAKPDEPEWLGNWLRGNQGMAQALLSTETGVQLAVGMRYKLEDRHAKILIHSFFRSLLLTNKGNVEAAVKSAREALNEKPGATAWSAPAIYRNRNKRDASMAEEPLFEFLLRPPGDTIDPVDLVLQGQRASTWRHLSQWTGLQRSPLMLEFPRKFLLEWEQSLIQRATERKSVVLISRPKPPAGALDVLETLPSATVEVPLYWSGSAAVKLLRFEAAIDGPAVSENKIKMSDNLKDLGYSWREVKEDDKIYFEIYQRAGVASQPLPAGTIATMHFKLGAETGVVYAITLSAISDPNLPICPIPNAIVVPLQ
jgi:CHAT domain-containing protein